ncbi:MAG: YggS family pyridoxal phosphate-dependent enzyme [Elusimicrobia bacterium]|nr:YggS family pyridoxal phosphate-dependent enzyme [Elusimicrobiota bacterium]
MILDNLKKIRYCLDAAAKRAGRDPGRVGLVVVTKYATTEQIREAIASGMVSEIGESRIQSAEAKKSELGELAQKVRWRLIGHLQTNKARKAADLFDAVDSVDSPRVAQALENALAPLGKSLPVLVQVKLTDRDTQGGVAPDALEGLLRELQAHQHLRASGLMAIAPQAASPDEVRPHFRRMRGLFDRFFAGQPGAQLSMGMSSDYEVAVEEGATLVRLGSVVFGH